MSPDRIDINLLSLLAQQKDMRVQQGIKHGKRWKIVVFFYVSLDNPSLDPFFLI